MNDSKDNVNEAKPTFSIVDMLSSKKGQLIVTVAAVVILVMTVSLVGLFSAPPVTDNNSDIGNVIAKADQSTPTPIPATIVPTTTAAPGDIQNEHYDYGSAPVATDEEGHISKVTITPLPTVEPTQEPLPFENSLSYGDDNGAISTVQTRYMALNYMDYDEPTEHFGPNTKDATILFQRRNGLAITGVIDENTYRLLMSAEAKVYMVALGDDGDDVYELQERLFEMGYLKSKPTGHFGTDTYDAVLLFQTNNDLNIDGMIGERTREILYSSEAVPNVWVSGDSNVSLITYQERLKKLGYLTTEPDGYYGSDTVAAVKRFQDRNSLISDGYLGPQTMSALLSDDAIANSLAMGMKGDDVKNVQKALLKLKYVNSDMVTGYFGAATDHAVRAFQKANDLTADGRVGKSTMSRLIAEDAKAAPKGYTMYTSPSNNGNNDDDDNDNNDGGNDGGDTTPSVANLIRIAKSRLGCRYVRGGKGPKTFDCSGFVYWCLNEAGIHQSYLTSYAWRSVTRYPRINSIDDLKAGDVIVFYGHVGLIVSDSDMIDASSTKGKVVQRSYHGSWSRKEFICGYRVMG